MLTLRICPRVLLFAKSSQKDLDFHQLFFGLTLDLQVSDLGKLSDDDVTDGGQVLLGFPALVDDQLDLGDDGLLFPDDLSEFRETSWDFGEYSDSSEIQKRCLTYDA